MTKRYSVISCSMLLVLIAAGRSPAQTVSFDERPSVQFGTAARVDLTARFQADLHEGSAAPGADDAGFDVARRRIGAKGTVSSHLEFEVERELGAGRPWRDAFVNLRSLRQVQLRAGQFKMPFSLEQLTSATNLDFVYRSRAADMLAPGRGVGASVHGRLAGRSLGYEAGVFRRDGENARFGSNPGAGQTVAARLTVRPRTSPRRSGSIGDIEVGVNATSGELPEGRYSLRGRLTSRSTFFEPVFVKGIRRSCRSAWRPSASGVVLRAPRS
jgi:phosphate-selective porin